MSVRRPRIIAEQARHAHGLLGRILAFIMARETWAANLLAIEALDIAFADHVLVVGCGHGRSLAALAARAPRGKVVGVDPSGLMAEIARKRNRRLAKASRVKVIVATADNLPFPDATFDKALCVHVVYFWPDLETPLAEIARVLKPGGRLALLFRTSADLAATAAFPPEIYRFPAWGEMVAALKSAGFAIDGDQAEGESPEPVLIVARRCWQNPEFTRIW